jgi:endoglucanase
VPSLPRIRSCSSVSGCLLLLSLSFGLSNSSFAEEPTGWQILGRGINFGNILEAPSEGAWGLRFDDEFPTLVKEAGFDSVRIPVRWSAHTADQAPYLIEEAFLARVHHIVNKSLDADLKVVLNIHHFEELYEAPEQNREKFLAIWRQLSKEFQHHSDQLVLEILNEPHGKLDAKLWNPLLKEALSEIRELHPERWVMVGPDQWNGIRALPQLVLPEDDRRLIVTVHYYLPFPFTHQGASWVNPSPPIGKEWLESPDEIAAMEKDFQSVADWASTHGRPIYIGEFGAFEKADTESRVRWMRQVKSICEKHQFSWAYWELASGFGILDPRTKEWKSPLLQALK